MNDVSDALSGNVWVFHSGALGDHVMIWPLVRAMARQGARVTVVGAASHIVLCEREVGKTVGAGAGRVVGMSLERARFTGMWAGRVEEKDVERGVDVVMTFVADEESEAGQVWMSAAREMFPGARVMCVGAPGSASRRMVWERARVPEFGAVALNGNVGGPVVLFVGAGGESKRWPMDRWVELARRLSGSTRVQLLAGTVELERLPMGERVLFERADGKYVGAAGGAKELAEAIRAARLYVGCDTGPTHLAAQLGVRTVAVFGPTDARVWGPVGARVEVMAPDSPCGMEWLDVDRVVEGIRRMLDVRSD